MHDISLTSDRSPASGGRMLPEALENEAMERKNDGKQIWEKLREKRRKRKSERPGENQASTSSRNSLREFGHRSCRGPRRRYRYCRHGTGGRSFRSRRGFRCREGDSSEADHIELSV